MRILIVAPAFPPSDGIGPVRNGKVAKLLMARGHDVRVVSAHHPHHQNLTRLEIPADRAVYVPYLDLAAPGRIVQGGRTNQIANSNRTPGPVRRVFKRVWRGVQIVTHFPDPYVFWYPGAVRAARRVATGFGPEIVYSSSSPFTAHLVARRLASDLEVPWVADFRDPWADSHHTADYPKLRKRLERALERFTLQRAAGLVTAAPAYTDIMARTHAHPMLTMTNGFDAEDYPEKGVPSAEPHQLSLVYAGTLYANNQSVEPLLQALAILGERADDMRVTFYGKGLEPVETSARAASVSNHVAVHGLVPRDKAMALQVGADVLVLLAWENAEFAGVLPAKFFTYLGARRPILVLGPHGNLLGRMVEEIGAGKAAATGDAAASLLSAWLDEKRRTGIVTWRGGTGVERFARESQVAHLEAFLAGFVHAAGRMPTS